MAFIADTFNGPAPEVFSPKNEVNAQVKIENGVIQSIIITNPGGGWRMPKNWLLSEPEDVDITCGA